MELNFIFSINLKWSVLNLFDFVFLENSASEEIEFSRLQSEPNEMLSLTAFARKTAVE